MARRALPEPTVFRDDDEGFRRWVAAHPGGFVVNVEDVSTPREAWLHRADCASLTQPKVRVTASYVKYVGLGRAMFELWGRTRLGVKVSTGCACLHSGTGA